MDNVIEEVACARCGDPCDPHGPCDNNGTPICESCNDDLYDEAFENMPPISNRWLSEG